MRLRLKDAVDRPKKQKKLDETDEKMTHKDTTLKAHELENNDDLIQLLLLLIMISKIIPNHQKSFSQMFDHYQLDHDLDKIDFFSF